MLQSVDLAAIIKRRYGVDTPDYMDQNVAKVVKIIRAIPIVNRMVVKPVRKANRIKTEVRNCKRNDSEKRSIYWTEQAGDFT